MEKMFIDKRNVGRLCFFFSLDVWVLIGNLTHVT